MDHAREMLTHFSGPMGYALFYFLIMACGCGFPFNSDVSLITASALAAAGVFNLWILMVLAFIALLSGDTVTFFVGRKWGLSVVTVKPFSWIFPHQKVLAAQKYIQHHGAKFLFIVRFLPLIRTVLFFTAGTLKVKPLTFYLMDASATLIYLPIIMCSSYYASSNIQIVVETLKRFQYIFLSLMIITVTAVFLVQKRKRVVRS